MRSGSSNISASLTPELQISALKQISIVSAYAKDTILSDFNDLTYLDQKAALPVRSLFFTKFG
jgi:hypothetical protein